MSDPTTRARGHGRSHSGTPARPRRAEKADEGLRRAEPTSSATSGQVGRGCREVPVLRAGDVGERGPVRRQRPEAADDHASPTQLFVPERMSRSDPGTLEDVLGGDGGEALDNLERGEHRARGGDDAEVSPSWGKQGGLWERGESSPPAVCTVGLETEGRGAQSPVPGRRRCAGSSVETEVEAARLRAAGDEGARGQLAPSTQAVQVVEQVPGAIGVCDRDGEQGPPCWSSQRSGRAKHGVGAEGNPTDIGRGGSWKRGGSRSSAALAGGPEAEDRGAQGPALTWLPHSWLGAGGGDDGGCGLAATKAGGGGKRRCRVGGRGRGKFEPFASSESSCAESPAEPREGTEI